MIAIINYGAGNLRSVQNALQFLGKKYFIAHTPEDLHQAETIILPGVGSAKPAMEKLEKTGFAEYLKKTKKSVIGICLGMQLMAEFSEEGETKCLGVISGKVKKFNFTSIPLSKQKIKIPHIGWNKTNLLSPKDQSIIATELFYFVHSYYFDAKKENIFATCQYGIKFPAIVQHKNFIGIQFHPEKSGKAGLELLESLL